MGISQSPVEIGVLPVLRRFFFSVCIFSGFRSFVLLYSDTNYILKPVFKKWDGVVEWIHVA